MEQEKKNAEERVSLNECNCSLQTSPQFSLIFTMRMKNNNLHTIMLERLNPFKSFVVVAIITVFE